MKKKVSLVLSMVLVLILVLGSVPVFADSIQNSSSDFIINGTTLMRYRGTTGDVVVPDGITLIAPEAFKDNRNVTSVIMPDTVMYVHRAAFSGCTNLKKVVIPDSVVEIGAACFYGCVRLTDVTLSNKLRFLPDNTFNGCKSLVNIDIPESVEELGYSCFKECSSLSSITIPDSVVSLGEYCFRECTSLTSAKLSNSLISIPSFCFLECTSLVDIVLPDKLETIKESAFTACSALESIQLPDTLKIIESKVFSSCTNLVNMEIPDSVEVIGICSFFGTKWYSTVPQWQDGFYIYKDILFATSKDTPYLKSEELQTLYVPEGIRIVAGGSLAVPSLERLLKFEDAVIPPTESGATLESPLIEKIVLPNTVISVGSWLAYGNSNLVEVVFPESLKYIGDNAFSDSYTKNLTTVNLPYGLEYIGFNAFCGCNLTSVVIPETVQFIGWQAFKDNTSLSDVSIKNPYTVLDSNVFLNTQWLADKLKQSLMVIENGILIRCLNEGTVVVPDTVTSIALGCFAGSKVTSLTVNIPVVQGDLGLNDCPKLSEVILGESVKELKNYSITSNNPITLTMLAPDIKVARWGIRLDSTSKIKCYTTVDIDVIPMLLGYYFIALDTPNQSEKDFYNVVGDDDKIDLSDAQKILKYALAIEPSSVKYTLADAQMCLKIALAIVKI